MAKKYMARIEALRKQYLDNRVDMDVYNALYLTDGFQQTEGEPMILQKAAGFYNICAKKQIYIQEHELIVGGAGFKPRCGILCPDSANVVLEAELDTISTRPYDPFYLSEECKQIFREKISPYWKGKSFQERWRKMAPKDMAALRDSGMVFMDRKSVRGFGECTPAYDYLLANGLKKLKEEAQAKLDALDDSKIGDLEKSFFYRAEIIVCDGMILLANRHAELAEKMAAECTDPVRCEELKKIAQVCRRVPEYPAETFHEACQFMMFYQYAIFMEQNASSYNPGRVDQFLYPYYLADINAGRATDDDIQELLDCTWIKIAEMSLFQDAANAEYSAGYCITQQVTLGGITRSGNDAVNELSYMAIQAAMDVRMKEPNVSIRYNISKNPDSFLRKAVEAIRTGLSMPAVYHDDAGIRMMMNKGVPLRDAWNWNPCGCVETNLAGKLKGYTAVGDFNMGGVIEMVMNNGVSRKTGKQCSIQTGDPRSFKTFEEFVDAVKRQIDYFVDAAVSGDQLLDYLSSCYRPVPVLSLGIPYCMEHGDDYSHGGADYNCGGSMISVGQADIVNSLAAVKYLIYDEKKITMDTLCRALDADFVGYEDIREMCLAAPKYGNDDERADFCVGDIFTYLVDRLESYDTRLGKMAIGMVPVSSNTPHGKNIGALPSGRKAWTPLTDGVGATGGTDVNGPSALLKSVSHIPHARYTNGTQLNLKLEPSILEGDDGLQNGMNLIKTMCTLDVYHSQYNVIKRETLLDAQAHPEAHRDLLIRVAGYTAFFVELGRETQDEIIGRTEIDSWGGCGCG